ncbi:hypothetical protein C8J57DRAFT_1246148 [Mycena rebaudengoi]|nr:hypothetical protein C8J57DRAFT_1246148 [Mycena rebaudengoi]
MCQSGLANPARSRRARQEVDEAKIIHTTRTRAPSARKRGAEDDDDVSSRPLKRGRQTGNNRLGTQMCRASLVDPGAASVSAERAFSTGGVEALQFLKSSLHSQILFPEMPCSANEPALIDEEVEEEADAADNDGLGIWDACLADEDRMMRI